ncbi:hypothetical protein P153DRAFT_319747, partial [Dothidotthia symphoricarpi CBS 119687]
MRECALILASASTVFTAAVEGNLVSRMQHDADLRTEHADILQRASRQPSIYVHLLAESHGVAPTPRQYREIGDRVREYISDEPSEHAFYIDNMTAPFVALTISEQGYRKYLHTRANMRSTHRIAVLHRLCAGITARCLAIPPHQHDEPFAFPPAECGYSANTPARLAQHRARRSSNYVMNLVEDICGALHRAAHVLFPQLFTMHQFVVCAVFRPRAAAVAEMFCSALLQVWVEGGGGFNAAPAGRSVASAGR